MDAPGAVHPGEIASTLFSMHDSSQRRTIFPISALTGYVNDTVTVSSFLSIILSRKSVTIMYLTEKV